MINKYDFKPKKYKTELKEILNSALQIPDEKWSNKKLEKILRKNPKNGNSIFSRDQIVAGYRLLVEEKEIEPNISLLDKIKLRPVRTMSGVTPITVLTKPFPCPGKCIFCPNDVRMPKSYLADEPGAQRAERNRFDPYLQTFNRLQALQDIGHPTNKAELIVLGGTWSFYPEKYQIWFIKRCFDALNDFGNNDERSEIKTINDFEEAESVPNRKIDGNRKSYNQIVNEVVHNKGKQLIKESEKAKWQDLEEAHVKNETSQTRCVGLVIETRPDYIDEKETIKMRRLGATKIQIGIQSLDDRVMRLNKRGHGAKETAVAIKFLRLAGFKIHGHWMPNLYGATPDSDIKDYKKLWWKEYSPDELKIYPTSIIAKTELLDKYKEGKYKPYNYEELLKVLTKVMPMTPRYCRLTRVVRDIPSTDIIAGNKLTNFRQIAENELQKMGSKCECIRCREIKGQKVEKEDIVLETITYETSTGKEIFLSYKTKGDDKIIAFLRLSLPEKNKIKNHFIPELKDCAMIREVHVYGHSLKIGEQETGKVQHLGLGKKLISLAEELTKEQEYTKIAVISAIGTREYYKKFSYKLKNLYMVKNLSY